MAEFVDKLVCSGTRRHITPTISTGNQLHVLHPAHILIDKRPATVRQEHGACHQAESVRKTLAEVLILEQPQEYGDQLHLAGIVLYARHIEQFAESIPLT